MYSTREDVVNNAFSVKGSDIRIDVPEDSREILMFFSWCS